MTSVSTRFFGQPRETKWTFMRESRQASKAAGWVASRPGSARAQGKNSTSRAPNLWISSSMCRLITSRRATTARISAGVRISCRRRLGPQRAPQRGRR